MASSATACDTDTKLWLHMDGSDASTTFTDSSSSPKTVSPVGSAQLDTADKVFGSASGLFTTPGSDYLSITDHSDFDIGTDDFTVDFRFKSNRNFADGQYISAFLSSENNDDGLWILYDWENSRFTVILYPTSVNFSVSISKNTWYHLAVTRNGTNLRLFLDGTQIGSTTTNSSNIAFGSNPLIASAHNQQANQSFSGWIDEFRFVKGTAVWTGNFTPPSSAYTLPTSISKVAGVSYSSIKKISGVAIASVKKVAGLG